MALHIAKIGVEIEKQGYSRPLFEEVLCRGKTPQKQQTPKILIATTFNFNDDENVKTDFRELQLHVVMGLFFSLDCHFGGLKSKKEA